MPRRTMPSAATAARSAGTWSEAAAGGGRAVIGVRWRPSPGEIGRPRGGIGLGDLEPGAGAGPDRHPELGAGLERAGEGVARPLAGRGAGPTGEPALGGEAADVVLRAVAVRRGLGPAERHRRLGLAGVD